MKRPKQWKHWVSQSDLATKLPKQWKYWAKKSGLKPERIRGAGNGLYMIGRGRRWRVNCNGQFECSCQIEDFDRWANSIGAMVDGIPQTEKQFLMIVSHLVFLADEPF